MGEEAIYQLLWRSGKPEGNDLNASRTVRMGAADIGVRVNMAKKNVRQNISRLFEKLALEVLEDFEPMSSQPRLYRVFSYRQILERRRAAGLEFILRNKGVVFCTSSGEVVHLSPAYLKSPGDETNTIRPAVPKQIRHLLRVKANTAPASKESDADLEVISKAFNQFWLVDEAAVTQLLRECRQVRADAKPDEIAFFILEKSALALQNPKIINPTGLILATVPQNFAGKTFEAFRARRTRQLAAEAERVAEQQEREQRDREFIDDWDRREEQRLMALLSNPSSSALAKGSAEMDLARIRRSQEHARGGESA